MQIEREVPLAGCGKTTWGEKHMAASPDKRYMLLSIDAVLRGMRVCLGLRVRAIDARSYKGRA